MPNMGVAVAILACLVTACLMGEAHAYYRCSSKSDCAYKGCADRPCTSSSSYCKNGTWDYYCWGVGHDRRCVNEEIAGCEVDHGDCDLGPGSGKCLNPPNKCLKTEVQIHSGICKSMVATFSICDNNVDMLSKEMDSQAAAGVWKQEIESQYTGSNSWRPCSPRALLTLGSPLSTPRSPPRACSAPSHPRSRCVK